MNWKEKLYQFFPYAHILICVTVWACTMEFADNHACYMVGAMKRYPSRLSFKSDYTESFWSYIEIDALMSMALLGTMNKH